MRNFWKMMRRFLTPYNKYLWGSAGLNILSAILNIFSFTLIIPILKILFSLDDTVYTFIPWGTEGLKTWDVILNNLYYIVSRNIALHGAINVLLILCLVLILMTAFKTASYFGASAVMIPLRTGLVKDLRTKIYDKILSLPLGFFSQEKKGDIIARISGDVMEVENSITSTLDMLIKNPILIIFYFGTLLFISWELTLFVIIFAPIMIWLMGVIGRNLKKKSLEVQNLWSDTMSQVEETLGGLRVIKAFLAERKMSARFGYITESMRQRSSRVTTRQVLAHPVSEFLGTAMIAIVLWYGGFLILKDNSPIDAPTFIYYMVILYSVIQPIKDLSKAAYGIPKGMASIERINRILDSENNIKEKVDPVELKSFEKGISLRNVSFRYQEEEKLILDNVSLEIPKGKTVAIVGASGAGKSTLVDLIPRFYDTQSGEILIDGINIKDISIHSLRSLMGNVNQDPILFNDSIFNNIAFGVETASKEQVENAAAIANAHDFITEKEDGYSTNIGDRGVKLSGGQRQRISIARAILKNPPILILDEATASLDTESEKLVQDALDKLMDNRTTIAIAHRLSTVKGADEIIVMDEGRIVERGKHEELLAMNGYYKKLYEMQSL